MNRILDAFFTPYYLMTTVDSLIVVGILGGLSLLVWFLASQLFKKES